MNRTNYFVLCVLMALASITGCQSVHWSEGDWEKKNLFNMPLKKEKTPEFQTPDHIVVIWKQSTFRGDNGQKSKGFGGRIYFYNDKNEAVKADGELTIFGFDDSFEGAERQSADCKFVFKQEDFQKHFSVTDLGPSYSVWVPWNEDNEDSLRISLMPIFKTVEGKLVQGEQSVNVLTGSKPLTVIEREARKLTADGHVTKYQSYNGVTLSKEYVYKGREPVVGQQPVDEMKVTTIDVPTNSFQVTESVENTAPPMVFNQMHQRSKENVQAAKNRGELTAVSTGEAQTQLPEAAKIQSDVSSTQETKPASFESNQTTAKRGVFGAPGAIR